MCDDDDSLCFGSSRGWNLCWTVVPTHLVSAAAGVGVCVGLPATISVLLHVVIGIGAVLNQQRETLQHGNTPPKTVNTGTHRQRRSTGKYTDDNGRQGSIPRSNGQSPLWPLERSASPHQHVLVGNSIAKKATSFAEIKHLPASTEPKLCTSIPDTSRDKTNVAKSKLVSSYVRGKIYRCC